ncbi:hypothetical protein ACHAW5_001006 [Stephanodiscus triporus]|uniref:Uncharacterized protein n=1 Tax=Stephanodiscus triporus TaxID=2934178 RepID=A0ABD3NUY4_9STRA
MPRRLDSRGGGGEQRRRSLDVIESNVTDDGGGDYDQRRFHGGVGVGVGGKEILGSSPFPPLSTPNDGGFGDMYDYDEDGGGGGDGNDMMMDAVDDDGGSDMSANYNERNSDPGVHVQAEDDYLLPPSVERPRKVVGSLLVGGANFDPLRDGGVMGGGGVVVGVGGQGGLVTMNGPGGTPPAPGGGGGGGGNESVSLGTATQTHEVRMPMLLSTFKPATGCTNASDFVVRCFVARLRSGITVVKHGRSRWCKSRLRVLHVHPDGRSLSWKPALGEPSSGKRPPKLDLTTCREVRHAWSPDPDNPMFTGTPILRQKCEAANAHKSFALIFPKRTVDITAVTADQCKVLMEGFSALCFRLQVAQNVAQTAATSSGNQTTATAGGGAGGESLEERTATTTATMTNTNPAEEGATKGGGGGGHFIRRKR